jgi:hypothetical protein
VAIGSTVLPFDGIVNVVGYDVGVVCEDRMQGMLQMEKWVADGRELLQLVRLYCRISANFFDKRLSWYWHARTYTF